MDFEFSDEQRLLKDSVERLLGKHYGFEARRQHAQEPEGFSRTLWKQYADLGLLALPFEEQYGGIGGGPVDTMIVMEAFGRALVLEPYFATVVLGGSLLRLGGSKTQRALLLPKIASGEALMAFAHSEAQSRYNLADVATTALKHGDGFVLNGKKTLVLHGDSADKLIVSARLSGGRRDRTGIGLFLVDAAAKGLSRRGYATIDGQRAAEVTLSDVSVAAKDSIGEATDALPLIERVADIAIAAQCAEAVGAMAAMLDMTVDYLKTRKQFGVAIGAFQALQHRAADMFIGLEQARSMAVYATMMATENDPAQRSAAVSAAKVTIGRNGRFIGEQAVQLHGGIGMTMEYRLGAYFKRMTSIGLMFGDADHHLRKVAKAGGLEQITA